MGLIRYAGGLLRTINALANGSNCCCCCDRCFDEIVSADPEPYLCLLAEDVDYVCPGDVEPCTPVLEPECLTLPAETTSVGSCSSSWVWASACTACADRQATLLKFCDASGTPKIKLEYKVNCSAECAPDGIATQHIAFELEETLGEGCDLPTFGGRVTWNPLP